MAKDTGKMIKEGVSTSVEVVLLVVVGALIIGTILGNSVFSGLTIINTSLLEAGFGEFVTGLISFLSIIGVFIGIVWLGKYVRALFSKETGITNLTA